MPRTYEAGYQIPDERTEPPRDEEPDDEPTASDLARIEDAEYPREDESD